VTIGACDAVSMNSLPMKKTLDEWLAYCEQLHPKAIDMGLERVKAVADRMALKLGCPVITVAGTNGKGSTCAMLESILRQAGYRTGMFTSPHLVRFEERLRLLGETVDASELIASFEVVARARALNDDEISLTYFEFSTLAILHVMARSNLDVAILEVGLGGRLDAVNIIDADCAVITSIDLDHTELLGSTREAIGFEKAGIMRSGRPVVVSDPMPPQSVLDRAQALGADLWRFGVDFNVAGDKQQWAWAGRASAGPPQGRTAPLGGSAAREAASVGAASTRRYSGLAYPALRGANQLVNAAGVLAALTAVRDKLPVTAQAVRNGLAFVELPGRFQIIPGQPQLVLDVAHNPHSVAALAANLDAMGFFPTTHAVFGAMADKDLASMLASVNPLIDKWYFTDLPTPRAASAAGLQAQWQAQNTRQGVASASFKSPVLALQAAIDAADPADRIVVFGSFSTVGGVLQNGIPRLLAKHLSS
jgi:dihydrofolate synthase / folylpolyglutamate synthase